ncbi:MAG: hypothetical protein U5M23_04565 [Marinagarivorans sp.]|nr:hypothetical protein [Marinagarivorans sp.]
MIKKYRNVFLAAAIATAMTACGGGSKKDDPLSDPNIIANLTGSDATLSAKSALGIADLLAVGMLSVITQTSSFFDTFAAITDPGTTMGKVMGVKSDSPSGIASATVGADCQNKAAGGKFIVDIQLEIDKGAGNATPELKTGLKEFAEGDAAIVVGLNFTNCDEPKHTYNDDPNDSVYTPNEHQLIDGRMDVKLHSVNKIPGAESNTKDFQMQGTVSMKNFFIKSYTGTEPATLPDAATGDISIALSTSDIDNPSYDAVLDVGLTTSDKKADGTPNGYTRTAVKAEGSIGLAAEGFSISTYALTIGGSMRNTGTEAPGSYTLFTVMPIVKTGGEGIYPQAGEIGLIDNDTKLKHYATVTATGLSFKITQLDGAVKEGDCTWDEVSGADGKSCNI